MSNNSREKRKRELERILKQSQEAFLGEYKDEINGLLGLSKEDVNRITPDTTDLETYDRLIEVVKEASRQNMAQGDLQTQIEKLGKVAVQIAKMVPGLIK